MCFISDRTKKDVQRPKPRHSLPGSTLTDESLDTFSSTTTIRQAIYDEWRKEKMKASKAKLAEEKKKEEEEKKKKEKVQTEPLIMVVGRGLCLTSCHGSEPASVIYDKGF